jgi:hypothetical protein
MEKKVQKKHSLRLKIGNKPNYRLIGISSHENDYRLVWAINNKMSTQFTRTEDLIVHKHQSEEDGRFSRYIYYDEERYQKYCLLSNRCPDGFLFPEIKNFDFLIQVSGETTDSEIQKINRQLKKVEVISASYILEPEKIKGINEILPE